MVRRTRPGISRFRVRSLRSRPGMTAISLREPSRSNDIASTQVRDGFPVIAKRGQHLVGVGAEFRRHRIEPAAAMGELEAATGEAQPAIGRIDLLNGAARRYLRVIDHFLD